MPSQSECNPTLFQVNTRVTLSSLSRKLGRQATLDDFPDSELAVWPSEGFDWIWFLGVWQTGPAGRKVSLSHAEWQAEYRHLLPDFQEDDVCGSCFAIRDYSAHVDFGGDAALARLRDRVHSHGMRLLLDFVPNHTAPDHPWVQEHPEFYIHGNEDLLAREPQNYARVTTPNGPIILAFGRDPYFRWLAGHVSVELRRAASSGRASAGAREDRHSLRRRSLRHGDAGSSGCFRADLGLSTWSPFGSPTIQRIRAANPGFLFHG